MTPTASIPLAMPSPVFDLALARRLADASRRAYLPTATKAAGSLSSVLLCDGRVLMEDIGDAILIAVQGTKNMRGWLTDLDVTKKEIAKGVEVHAGFLGESGSMLPVITERLNGNCKPLLIGGHSKGGGDGTYLGFALQQSGFPVRAIYTFASPRVGNAGFRDAYNELCGAKTFRVICAGDVVPLIPGVLDGYRHVGQEVLLNGGKALVNPSHYTELLLDSWRTARALERQDWEFILKYHGIDTDYIPALNRVSP